MKHVPSPSRRRKAGYTLAAAAALCLLGLTLYARASLTPTVGRAGVGPVKPAARQETKAPARSSRSRNLALQPAAQNFARRVGRRFVEAGRELSVIAGTLSAGGEQKRVSIRRLQGDGGESFEVTVDGGPASLSWDAGRGALASGVEADATQRALLERLVMDSPDQFALAQLRGASYYTVARNVRAADDGGADGYTGPLHDVVRVGEPARDDGKGWSSTWRLYYVNTATGLIEKIISEEGGAGVEAVLSEWGSHAGEKLPGRVTWSRGGQVFMELTLQNVTHGPRQ